jgi:hypothetical protein
MTYIGSTTLHSLDERLRRHEESFEKYQRGIGNYVTSFQIIQGGNYAIELVEEVGFESKRDLLQAERRHIEASTCVNKIVPLRTKLEYREANKAAIAEYDKEYYTKHKEAILKRKAEYRDAHKEETKAKRQAYFTESVLCECGASVRRSSMSSHKKSKTHFARGNGTC